MKNGMVQNSSFPRYQPCPSTGIPEIPILPTFAPAKSTCRCAYCRLIGGCSRSRTGATCNRVLARCFWCQAQVWIVASKHTVSVRQNQGFLECPHVVYARDQSGAHWWSIKEQIEDYQLKSILEVKRGQETIWLIPQTISLSESSAKCGKKSANYIN